MSSSDSGLLLKGNGKKCEYALCANQCVFIFVHPKHLTNMSNVVDRIGELIVGVILLYVLFEVIKQLSESSPGFGGYVFPIFVAAAAALLIYAKYGRN